MQLNHSLRIPFTGLRKIYQSGHIHTDLKIPVREISLTNGENFFTYDTSSAFTDENVDIDITQGLRAVRVQRLNIHPSLTQLAAAKREIITPEMEYIAIRKHQSRVEHGARITSEFVCHEIKSGCAIVPANIKHVELEPMVMRLVQP